MYSENGNNGMYMPVAPAGNGGMWGDQSCWWFIIVLAMMGWGNGFGGGWGNNGVNADLQRGFDQAAVTNGISNIQTALCNGFANINNAISSGFAQAEIGANARQMADMNQNFAIQTGIGDLKYSVATEACADRNAISNALRDVLEANNASTQKILDVMCQDKLDAKNETIAMLRQQLTMAQMSSADDARAARILADNAAQTSALEQYLAPVARPAYIVQNPNGCGCNQSFGCGCGN